MRCELAPRAGSACAGVTLLLRYDCDTQPSRNAQANSKTVFVLVMTGLYSTCHSLLKHSPHRKQLPPQTQLIAEIEAPMLKAMVLAGSRAGLCAGVIRALRWRDIDYGRNEIIVMRAEYRGVVDKPKSGAGRRIPLPSRLKAALALLPRGLARDALCFPMSKVMLTEGQMTPLLVAAACRAGIKTAQSRRQRKNDHQRAYRLRRLKRDMTSTETAWLAEHEASRARRFGWHTLRHTFCTHLAVNGTSIVRIQAWAGHADITTTQRYMHWAPSEGDAHLIDSLDAPTAKVLALVD